MKPLLALAALLIAAATLWYVRRPHDREYVMVIPPDPIAEKLASEAYDDDGIQPFDPRTAATGLAAA